MAVITKKPVTPGQRNVRLENFADLTAAKPHKPLLAKSSKTGGRNMRGVITVRHRGGGHKQRYRLIDLGQGKLDVAARVATLEYDPFRTAWIALVIYTDGTKAYILAPHGLKVGDTIRTTKTRGEIKPGNRMPLETIPTGTFMYNIELIPNMGGKMVRSAGAVAQLVGIEGRYAQVKMPSGEVRMILKDCYASIGQVGNLEHNVVRIGKAGRNRWLGKRPQVRGKAMNPVDHPHGGGEGGTSIGMKYPKTPWGKHALGVRTRKAKKHSNRLIITRRGSKKRS